MLNNMVIVHKKWPEIYSLLDKSNKAEIINSIKLQSGTGTNYVFLGLGDGIYIKHLFKQYVGPNDSCIIFEPDLKVLNKTLKNFDVSEMLQHPRTTLIYESKELCNVIYKHFVLFSGRLQIIKIADNMKNNAETFENTEAEIHKFLMSQSTNIKTTIAFGNLFLQNIIRNLPEIAQSYSCESLSAEGTPALIVASGPSLDNYWPQIQAFKGVMFCADSAFSACLVHQVNINFVTSVDPQPGTYDKYKVIDCSNTALVYHPATAWQIPRNFKGPKYVCCVGMAPYTYFKDCFEEKLSLEHNVQCQIHLALNLAIHMKCNPIIFVGLDLSWTDIGHARSAMYYEKPEDGIPNIIDTIELGEGLKTSSVFMGYKKAIEEKIAANALNVLQFKGGLELEGAEQIINFVDDVSAWENPIVENKSCDNNMLVKRVMDVLNLCHTLKNQIETDADPEDIKTNRVLDLIPDLFYLVDKSQYNYLLLTIVNIISACEETLWRINDNT